MTSFAKALPLTFLLVGCSTLGWHREPSLPFPDHPSVTFTPPQPDSFACLIFSDTVTLSRWLDKIDAFKRARERLLK